MKSVSLLVLSSSGQNTTLAAQGRKHCGIATNCKSLALNDSHVISAMELHISDKLNCYLATFNELSLCLIMSGSKYKILEPRKSEED